MSFRLTAQLGLQRGSFALHADFTTTAPVTALFGPSGAGKTSLLDALAGLQRPTRGRILLGDEPLFDSERRIDVPAHRRRIGYVFQDGRLFPHQTVEDNLRYGERREQGGPRFADVVEILGIGTLLRRRPRQLSGGEQRRVALGRALLSAPRLLLLDEPLAAVERGLREHIASYLMRIRDELKVPMLYVSHSLEELLQLTQHFVVLGDGAVIGSGSYLDLLTKEPVFAVADRLGLMNVLRVVVEAAAESAGEEGVTRARLGGQVLRLPPGPEPPGRELRIGIRPQDLVLARDEPVGLSVQNVLRAQVGSMSAVGHAVLVRLTLDHQEVVAEVTGRARDELGLQPGQTIYCLFKAHAIERLGTAGAATPAADS